MKRMRAYVSVMMLVSLFLPPAAASSDTRSITIRPDRQEQAISGSSREMKSRTALVIGNSSYPRQPLKQPAGDAAALAAALRPSGWSVTVKTNTTRRQLKRAIGDFGKTLRGGGIGLFYFAGYGMQINGQNYLLPVDAEIESESDLAFEAVALDFVLETVADAGNDVTIVMLDACRDNPFSGGFRSGGTSGLARINASAGSVIAYAAQPGSVAVDGTGSHSPFTAAIRASLKQPGLTVGQLFKKVRNLVIEQTAGKQVPWESSSLADDVPFQPGSALISPAAAGYGMTPEEELWLMLKQSNDPDELEIYLREYPDGRFATVAKLRIRRLREAAERSTLTIETEPRSATVKILDIREHYHPGMSLAPGQYRLVVSAAGYKTRMETIEVPPATACRQKIVLTARGPRQGDKYTDPLTGMVFVYIEGGCYQMGSPASEAGGDGDERPVHTVCVDGFYMGIHEVTNRQYRKYRPSHRSAASNGMSLDGDNQPVIFVSWEDAHRYALWLSRKSGKRYRLPTEAEWEYAARGGRLTARFWGDRPDAACGYANSYDLSSATAHRFEWPPHRCDDRYAVTAPVGSFRPNGYGLYDMLGNVWEWCSDWYGKRYYASSPEKNPSGPTSGTNRVLRGGGWGNYPRYVRSANRGYNRPDGRHVDMGFRLVLQVP